MNTLRHYRPVLFLLHLLGTLAFTARIHHLVNTGLRSDIKNRSQAMDQGKMKKGLLLVTGSND